MLVTPEATLYFPSIEKGRSYKGSDPRYGGTLVFDNEADLEPLEEAIEAALDNKFDKRPDDLMYCYNVDGTEEEKGFPYDRYLRVSAQVRPAIAIEGEDLQGASQRQLEDAAKRFRQGSTVRARVRIYAYSSGGNKGVTAFLDSILLVKEADPHAFRASTATDWA